MCKFCIILCLLQINFYAISQPNDKYVKEKVNEESTKILISGWKLIKENNFIPDLKIAKKAREITEQALKYDINNRYKKNEIKGTKKLKENYIFYNIENYYSPILKLIVAYYQSSYNSTQIITNPRDPKDCLSILDSINRADINLQKFYQNSGRAPEIYDVYVKNFSITNDNDKADASKELISFEKLKELWKCKKLLENSLEKKLISELNKKNENIELINKLNSQIRKSDHDNLLVRYAQSWRLALNSFNSLDCKKALSTLKTVNKRYYKLSEKIKSKLSLSYKKVTDLKEKIENRIRVNKCSEIDLSTLYSEADKKLELSTKRLKENIVKKININGCEVQLHKDFYRPGSLMIDITLRNKGNCSDHNNLNSLGLKPGDWSSKDYCNILRAISEVILDFNSQDAFSASELQIQLVGISDKLKFKGKEDFKLEQGCDITRYDTFQYENLNYELLKSEFKNFSIDSLLITNLDSYITETNPTINLSGLYFYNDNETLAALRAIQAKVIFSKLHELIDKDEIKIYSLHIKEKEGERHRGVLLRFYLPYAFDNYLEQKLEEKFIHISGILTPKESKEEEKIKQNLKSDYEDLVKTKQELKIGTAQIKISAINQTQCKKELTEKIKRKFGTLFSNYGARVPINDIDCSKSVGVIFINKDNNVHDPLIRIKYIINENTKRDGFQVKFILYRANRHVHIAHLPIIKSYNLKP